MGYLDDPSEEPVPESRSRIWLVAAVGGFVLAVVAAGWWHLSPTPAPPEPTRAAVDRQPSRPAVAAPATPPPSAPREPATREPRTRARSVPEPAAPAVTAVPTPAAPARELVVDVDVEGAMVFLDRKFVGNAPVKTTDVEAGTHQLNVSATGYDGVVRSIEIAESGPTAVTVRLKEVRLSSSVDVVHKHAMGSCQGRLSAELSGLKYAPTGGDDGFTLPFDAIEVFEVDYLKKNLRIKRKGGRTWNFESPAGGADPLFVFHRDVDKARTKLAAGAAQ